MASTNWTKGTTTPTAYTKQTFNATSWTPVILTPGFLTQEDGFYILQETGYKIYWTTGE